MAPRRSAANTPSKASGTSTSSSAGTPSHSSASAATATAPAAGSNKATSPSTADIAPALRKAQDMPAIATGLWDNYVRATPPRTKLLDAFMAFLVAVGALQFVYCVIGGNYPFNAFLAGFSATVGQFVLTASLRMQTDAGNAKEFSNISHERAFADYVFGSVILHFFCVNFIN